jgi:MarR family transcriptional regulator, organic hydroperoxide resistance regulator
MKKFVIDDSLGYKISITNAAMRGKFNRTISAQGLNVSSEQWGVMNIIKTFPGLTQKELAAKLYKDKTNLTRMIDVLERDGYLERKEDKKDRRIFRIFITGSGEELINKIIPIAESVNRQSSSGLSNEELSQLKSLLKKVQDGARKGGKSDGL